MYNLQCQEDESLARQLQITRSTERRIQLALALVVVLSREHKRREPEVAEDEVRQAVVELVGAESGEDEGGHPEAENDGRLAQ
jgi:hypothetical protein